MNVMKIDLRFLKLFYAFIGSESFVDLSWSFRGQMTQLQLYISKYINSIDLAFKSPYHKH